MTVDEVVDSLQRIRDLHLDDRRAFYALTRAMAAVRFAAEPKVEGSDRLAPLTP